MFRRSSRIDHFDVQPGCSHIGGRGLVFSSGDKCRRFMAEIPMAKEASQQECRDKAAC